MYQCVTVTVSVSVCHSDCVCTAIGMSKQVFVSVCNSERVYVYILYPVRHGQCGVELLSDGKHSVKQKRAR